MELAARVAWRRCVALRAPPAAARSLVSCAPVPCVLPRRVSLSLCSRAGSTSVCSLRCPAALTLLRTLCAGSSRCWSCQVGLSGSELFCPACSSIQPPVEGRDYYQLLDCERSFNINIQELQRKYRNLQRFLHPDYFGQKSKQEQDISEKQSSLVNKAYNTLLSPLSRGIYLLSLHGISIPEGTEGSVDAPLLLEILEINEKLNDMSAAKEMEEIGMLVQETCQSLTENIREAFEKGDLDCAKVLLVKMKYYVNILDQVKKKMIP
ncbi:iron-sulfur cluster co-chaperone protein HscB [Hyla sarda]|uniref:iron-sulfur cluster co-chaperone protein HscB n=1 Tax=Hyla sarda TaxID=327740 RepID=UPI0024C26D31|nr:iron-sulfur cluster co-chaperone protein HscB [Hyla sarda]